MPPLFKLVRGHSQSTDGRLTDGGLSCASLREHDHLLTNEQLPGRTSRRPKEARGHVASPVPSGT